VALIAGAVLAWPLAAATPTAKPEEVGFSSERLHRISDLVQRHITAGSFSGAVTLVARNGRIARIARFEAQGLMAGAPRPRGRTNARATHASPLLTSWP
jgi:hypothetical protein